MAPLRDLADVKSDLIAHATALLNRETGLHYRRYSFHLGVYRGYGTYIGQGPGAFFAPKPRVLRLPEAGRAERLGISIKHRVLYNEAPLLVRDNRGRREIDASHITLASVTAAEPVRSPNKELLLHSIVRRADLLWDDASELQCSGIPFFAQVAGLSAHSRRRVFSRSIPLEEIVVPDSCQPWASDFHLHLKQQCTYARADGGHHYYPKWRALKPTSPRSRVFQDTKCLGDIFLQNNFVERELRRDRCYLFLQRGTQVNVYMLFFNAHGVLETSLLYFNADDLSALSADLLLGLPDEGSRTKQVMGVFFYAMEGLDSLPRPQEGDDAPRLSVSLDEVMVDPVAMVKSAVGRRIPESGGRANAGLTKHHLRSEWDWFSEMVRLYFPERVVELSTAGFGMFHRIDRGQMYLNAIEREASLGGPISATLRAGLDRIRDDDEVLLLPQGFRVGSRQAFVGTFGDWTYLRNLETGVTTKLPTAYFVVNLRIGELSGQIYRTTQAIIPFAMAVGWATVILAGAIVAPGAAVVAFRYLMREVVREAAVDALDLLRAFRHQLHALVMYGFLCLIPIESVSVSGSPVATQAVRSQLYLARGFLRGFSLTTVEFLFHKYELLLTRGPRYYRWFRLYKRINAARRELEDKVSAVRGTVTAEVAERLAESLGEVARHSQRGTVLLLTGLMFLDHRQAEPFLRVTAGLSGTSLEDAENWETARRQRLKLALDSLGDHYLDEARALVSGHYSDWYRRNQTELAALNFAFEVNFYSWLGRVGYPWTLIASLVALAGYDIKANDAKVVTGLGSLLLKDLSYGHWQAPPDELERYGEVVGHLVGAVYLDRSLTAKGSRLERIGRIPFLGGHIADELKHGWVVPGVRLLFHHYVRVYERIHGAAREAAAEFRRVQTLLGQTDPNEDLRTRNEQRVTFAKLGNALTEWESGITRLLEGLASGNVESGLHAARSITELGAIPTFESLTKKAPLPDDPVPVAMLFAVLSHLHVALSEFRLALEALQRPLDPQASVSILSLLEIIGIEIDEDAADDRLSAGLSMLFAPPASTTD